MSPADFMREMVDGFYEQEELTNDDLKTLAALVQAIAIYDMTYGPDTTEPQETIPEGDLN